MQTIIFRRNRVLPKGFFHSGVHGGFGAVISRVPNAEWLKEMDSFTPESGKKSAVNFDAYVPESARSFTRIHDREAGDDDAVSFRTIPNQVVCDTKLIKAKTSSGFAAVQISGPDTLVDIISENRSSKDVLLWREISSRIEYLSPALSVKSIRLLLKGLAEAKPPFTSAEMMNLMESLGQEILCRFHSLTLFSCCSIAESMAVLNCSHRGTLNVLALACKQNLEEEIRGTITPAKIVDICVRTLSAFDKLRYTPPIIIESVKEALRKNSEQIDIPQRLSVIETLLEVRPDFLDHNATGLLITNTCEGLFSLDPDKILKIITLATKVKGLRDVAKILIENSVIIAQDGKRMVVKQLKGMDNLGENKYAQHLLPCTQETLTVFRDFLDATSPQFLLIDKIVKPS